MPQFALKIQRKISKGWRKESIKLGQLYDLVRNFNVIKVNVPVKVRIWHRRSDIEHDPVSYTYLVRCDRKILQVNDQFVGKDPASVYEASALKERYTIVSMRLLRDNIAVRTDEQIQIFRPDEVIGVYSEETPLINSKILAFDPNTLLWSFVDQPAAPGLITTLYAGITFGQGGQYKQPEPVPLSTTASGWMITLGLLPGVILQEADIVVDQDEKAWYRVDRPYRQEEGSFLYQLHAGRVKA